MEAEEAEGTETVAGAAEEDAVAETVEGAEMEEAAAVAAGDVSSSPPERPFSPVR